AANELVAELLVQHGSIGRQGRRIARDVHDPGGPEPAGSTKGLSGEPGARRIDDDDVRPSDLRDEPFERLPDVPRPEAHVLDRIELRVLDRTRNGLFRDLDAPDGLRAPGERERDRPRAAIEVEDPLAAGEP